MADANNRKNKTTWVTLALKKDVFHCTWRSTQWQRLLYWTGKWNYCYLPNWPSSDNLKKQQGKELSNTGSNSCELQSSDTIGKKKDLYLKYQNALYINWNIYKYTENWRTIVVTTKVVEDEGQLFIWKHNQLLEHISSTCSRQWKGADESVFLSNKPLSSTPI